VRQIRSLREAGAQVDVLEVKGIKMLKYLQCLPMLHALAREVDLVHGHYGYCGWLARSQFGKPVVVSFMGDDLLGTPDDRGRVGALSKLVVQIDCRLARAVDAVIVKSAQMASVVARAGVKAQVVPNGVDMQAFQPMEPCRARELLGWSQEKRYVLFPSSPDIPGKRFALAQAAVAGAAPRVDRPLELVKLWSVSPDKVPLYMNACNAMLMTSFLEGSPNVVKEAMACNLPVVSVPVGDVPELLEGVANCAICPRDPEALASALVDVLASSRRSDGRSAVVRKGLDQESVARRIMGIYEQVLARRGR
jgi:glycosyltransferase involved in cell wall biosynthesis